MDKALLRFEQIAKLFRSSTKFDQNFPESEKGLKPRKEQQLGTRGEKFQGFDDKVKLEFTLNIRLNMYSRSCLISPVITLGLDESDNIDGVITIIDEIYWL